MNDDLPAAIRGLLCPECNQPLDVVDSSARVAAGPDPSKGKRGVEFRCREHGGWHWLEGSTFLTAEDGKPAAICALPSKPGRARVYYYIVGDIMAGENVRRGPATLAAIWMAGGTPMWETGHELSLSELDGDGFSSRKGEPKPPGSAAGGD